MNLKVIHYKLEKSVQLLPQNFERERERETETQTDRQRERVYEVEGRRQRI